MGGCGSEGAQGLVRRRAGLVLKPADVREPASTGALMGQVRVARGFGRVMREGGAQLSRASAGRIRPSEAGRRGRQWGEPDRPDAGAVRSRAPRRSRRAGADAQLPAGTGAAAGKTQPQPPHTPVPATNQPAPPIPPHGTPHRHRPGTVAAASFSMPQAPSRSPRASPGPLGPRAGPPAGMKGAFCNRGRSTRVGVGTLIRVGNAG